MKKKILTATVAFLMSFSAIFANDIKPVPTLIVNELKREFKNVSNLEWKTTDNFYKASFTADGNSMEAFFSYDGELIGVSRNIKLAQLPLSLVKETKQLIGVNQPTQLFELLTDRGTEYLITFNTGKDVKTFKSDGYSWSRY
jgi:hypothetical protein